MSSVQVLQLVAIAAMNNIRTHVACTSQPSISLVPRPQENQPGNIREFKLYNTDITSLQLHTSHSSSKVLVHVMLLIFPSSLLMVATVCWRFCYRRQAEVEKKQINVQGACNRSL